MPDISLLAVAAGTLAAFVLGGAYYAVLGDRLAAVSAVAAAHGPAPTWTYAAELGRCLVLAAVLAGLAAEAQVDAAAGGLLLGLVLWVGFPLVLWIGAVVHERTPPALAAIHAGDWLVKLLVVTALIAAVQ